MPNVKVKNYHGEYVIYENVEKLHLTAADSDAKLPFSYGEALTGVMIAPDFSGGDQTVEAVEGTLVKSAIIQKPETLTPENIRNGVTVAGVEGEFIGDTEEAIVELSMADGDQVVEPTEAGKVLTKVTVKKPDTLVPENIAKDVEIAGVTGTHEGGGSTADYTIAYMSIDGTEELYLKPIMHGDTAGDVIALRLMDEPVIENTSEKEYTFLGWSDSIGGEVKTSMFETVTENRTVYAVYKIITTLATGECGETVTWKLTDDGLLVISGEGLMADYAAITEQPWYEYAASVKTVKIEEGVTSVGNYAFRQLANLSAVDLPESLTTIGDHAFRACAALTSITIPDNVTRIGNYMCYQATSLKSAVIGNGVTYIGLYAFHTCTALSSVTMGNSVKTIYYRAFQGCSALKSIVIPASCNLIGDNAFYGTGLISANIEYTNGWAYYTSETATSGYTLVPSYLKNTSTAATYLRSTYVGYWWKNTLV